MCIEYKNRIKYIPSHYDKNVMSKKNLLPSRKQEEKTVINYYLPTEQENPHKNISLHLLV